MAIPTDDKHKNSVQDAAHRLYPVTAATHPDSRAIQNEMVAEWLKLADAILCPVEISK